MVVVKCVQKRRDMNGSGKIRAYALQDKSGCIKEVYPDELKQGIRAGQIKVVNLKLTKDGRLIDCKEEQSRITDIKAYEGGTCRVVSDSPVKHTLYIPDEVTKLNNEFDCLFPVRDALKRFKGAIKVIGGASLVDVSYMFADTHFSTIDVTNLVTTGVEDMSCMFCDCAATKIYGLERFDTRNVIDMSCMFANCKAQTLDLSSFSGRSVANAEAMFADCKAARIDLSRFAFSWDIPEDVESGDLDITDMFKNCEAQIRGTDPQILKLMAEQMDKV